jgi:peptidoglycan hydrolase-like protein with peptidoglycan-binding domain/2'-5' RNA ligase
MTVPSDDIKRMLYQEDKHTRGTGAQGGQFVAQKTTAAPAKKPTPKPSRPAAKKQAPAKRKPPRTPTPLDVLALKAYRNFGSFKAGDSDPAIRDVQELLNGLGLASPDGKKIYPDGNLGPATTAAIKAMQAKLGAKKPNGRITASLMRKLQDTALLSPCAARSAVMEIAYEDLIERADGDPEYDAPDDAADATEVEEEPEHTGAMIALIPTVDDADRLAVEGFEPADELHVTLLYLGDAADIAEETRQAIIDGLESLVEDAIRPDYHLPLEADAFAVAVFNPEAEDPCIVLGLSGSELDEVHDLITDAVDEATSGAMYEQRVPWIPHLTLQYTDDTSRIDDLFDRTGPVEFDRIRVAFGDQVTDIPLAPPLATARAQVQVPDVDYWTTGQGRDRWLHSPTPHALLQSLLADHVDDHAAGQMATRCITEAFATRNGSNSG